LGTPPRAVSQSLPDPINYHAPESASIEHPRSVSSRMATPHSCTVFPGRTTLSGAAKTTTQKAAITSAPLMVRSNCVSTMWFEMPFVRLATSH